MCVVWRVEEADTEIEWESGGKASVVLVEGTSRGSVKR